MAAALTVTAAKTRNNAVATLTGGPASAAVIFVASSSGTAAGQQELINATTDGSGNATATFVPPAPGTLQIRVIQHQPDLVIAGPSSALVTAG